MNLKLNPLYKGKYPFVHNYRSIVPYFVWCYILSHPYQFFNQHLKLSTMFQDLKSPLHKTSTLSLWRDLNSRK